MAEMKTPNGLVVGLIPDTEAEKGDQNESVKPVEKPARGRKAKE
jgi:hypothetical protein